MRLFSDAIIEESIKENISDEITEILESAFETQSIINSYMIESSNIVNESAFIDAINIVAQKIVKFIKYLYEKFISLFMKKTDYIEYILNKYSGFIKNLTDEDLKNIVYEYKEFNFPKNVPSYGYFNIIQKSITNLSKLKITTADIENFKYIYTEQLDLIRGKIIGVSEKVPQYEFASRIKSIFRGSDEVFVKELTKRDLNRMIDDFIKYKDVKKMIEADRDNILREYDKYVKIALNVINVKFDVDSLGASLKSDKGEKVVVDIATANRHKEYQALIVSFISQIMESYSVVFKEKLDALKDKYNMETEILKKIISLVV